MAKRLIYNITTADTNGKLSKYSFVPESMVAEYLRLHFLENGDRVRVVVTKAHLEKDVLHEYPVNVG